MKPRNLITLAQVVAWGPCCRKPGEQYDDAHLAALFAGRPALTWLEVAALDIPRADVVWLATKPGALPSETHVRLANRWTDRSVEAHALHCGVPAVETWAARWLSGEDRSARSAKAARAAAGEAAGRWSQRYLAGAATAAVAATAAAEAAAEAAVAAAEAAAEAEAAAWEARAAAAASRAARWGSAAAAAEAAAEEAGAVGEDLEEEAAERALQVADLLAVVV
jgi:SWI/SNF-related matrix-associated actin-dependent regulator 1 of chromatin subfamily A